MLNTVCWYCGIEIYFNGSFYIFYDFTGEEYFSNSLDNAKKYINKMFSN